MRSLPRFNMLLGVALLATLAAREDAQGAAPADPATVESVTALRAGNFGHASNLVVEGYRSATDAGGGSFILNVSDSNSRDNGCTIIVDAAGHRFYRKDFHGKLEVAKCGVMGDGAADDTVALQSAINVICHGFGEGGVISIPPTYSILITAPILFKGCTGLRFGGLASAGSDTYSSATIMWGGSSGPGPMLSVNQAAASIFENLTIYTYNSRKYSHKPDASNVDVGIDDTESGDSVVQTNTDNSFSNIFVLGPPRANPNFVGIRIGYGDTRGNVDIATFNHISVLCSESNPTSATSNGSGIRFYLSQAEPFVTEMVHTQLLHCSAGFNVGGQISNLVLDGGASEDNYTDLLITSHARGLVFRNFRSESATDSVVASAGADITLDHDSFSAVQDTGINIQSQGQTIIDTVEFEDMRGMKPIAPNSGGSALTTIRNSIFPPGTCPTPGGWGGIISSHMNMQKVGSACVNFDALGAEGRYALAVPAGIAVFSSPKSDICGWYLNSMGLPRGFAEDCWTEQNVVGGGLNGTSTLEFSHSGTSGASSVQLPGMSLSHFLMGATAPTIGSGFSRDAAAIVANGTAAFTVTIGRAPESKGVINLPVAEHGWICQAQDITTHSRAVFQTVQTASSKSSCALTQFNSSMEPSAWASSDILAVHAFAY